MKTNLILRVFTIIVFLLKTSSACSQFIIKGKVTDATNVEIPFASVALMKNENVVLVATSTDMSGDYSINSPDSIGLSMKVTSIGFSPNVVKNITVKKVKATIVNVTLDKGVDLNSVDIIEYSIPIIDAGSPATNHVISREQIQAAPSRNVNSIQSQSAGVYQKDKGNSENIRGSRSDGTYYIVDGIKVRDNESKVKLIKGGIPGQYGDVSGGVISIDTDEYDKEEEQYDNFAENEYKFPWTDPLSTFSIDVDKASYSNVRRIIKDGFLPPVDAVRIEEMINYFHYNYPPPVNEPLAMKTELGKCPWNNDHLLLNIALKARDISDDTLPSSNFVFLLDVSGSMESPNKLPLVKKSIRLLVDNLRKQDKVAIVVYAGSAGMVLKPTSGDKKEEILEAIERLAAGGSTAGAQGIQLAYQLAHENFDSDKNNRIILCTDGDFNVGISNDDDLVTLITKEKDSGVFLSILGFGMGNYKDSKMEKLADKGNGNYAYIDELSEAHKVFITEMKGSLYTLAKDVKLQIEFNPAVIKSYRLIGYENRILAAEDFNNDKKDAGELGADLEVTALYELIPSTSTETLNVVDQLKYHQVNSTNSYVTEAATIKFRYKEPLDTISKLLAHTVSAEVANDEELSDNFRFASAVAEAGMLLRHSKFSANASFEHAIKIAKESKGTDDDGYRSEFIQLLKQMDVLSRQVAEVKDK